MLKSILLTAKQVAECLQIKPRAVRDLGIPAVRIGKGRGVLRYREEDIEAYVNLRVEYQGIGESNERRIQRRSGQVGLSLLPSRRMLQAVRLGHKDGSENGGTGSPC